MRLSPQVAAPLVSLLALFIGVPAFAQGIEGRWISYEADGKTRRALIEIGRQGPGFKGKIVEVYVPPGGDADPTCVDCPGEARGRKVRGLDILTLQSARSATEFDGRVLDPKEGKEYRCTAVLEPGGKRLSLRGYVLLSMFGRNVTWERAP